MTNVSELIPFPSPSSRSLRSHRQLLLGRQVAVIVATVGLAAWQRRRWRRGRRADHTKGDFNFAIRPILADKCYKCHGPDPRHRKAGLRLDTREGAFGATESGSRAVVPGNLEESELVNRITSPDPTERMPPESLGRTLSAGEIDQLKHGTRSRRRLRGRHWSFLPPVAAPPPEVNDPARSRNAIDRFVQARLDAERLTPAPVAGRERLIRRLSFDLTGLPPSVAEVDAFLADRAADAYDRLVDRLLASPRFGERMAIDWLDLARYADTYGYQADVYRAMWPWRDWVVHAFNSNLPYEQFVTWQLAGDLVPQATRAQVLATAFNRHHRQTNEGGSIEEEFRVEYVADRTQHVRHPRSCSWLTAPGAPRCHSHKYDPITQDEYYQLFSFFNSIDESGLYSHFTNAVPTPTLLLTSIDLERAIAASHDQGQGGRGRGSIAWRATGGMHLRPGSRRRIARPAVERADRRLPPRWVGQRPGR